MRFISVRKWLEDLYFFCPKMNLINLSSIKTWMTSHKVNLRSCSQHTDHAFHRLTSATITFAWERRAASFMYRLIARDANLFPYVASYSIKKSLFSYFLWMGSWPMQYCTYTCQSLSPILNYNTLIHKFTTYYYLVLL